MGGSLAWGFHGESVDVEQTFQMLVFKFVRVDESLDLDFKAESSTFQQILKPLGFRFLRAGEFSTLDDRVRGFCAWVDP